MICFRPFRLAALLLGALIVGTLAVAQDACARPPAHHARKAHQAAAKSAPAPEADWFADPALTPRLGPETAFGDYTLRLPPELILVDQRRVLYERHTEDISVFKGEKRPDGSRLEFVVGVASAGTKTIFMDSANELIQRMDDRMFANTTHSAKSPSVYGRINGLETLRQYFKATDKDGTAHGFQYWMAGPTSAIVIIADDNEPHNTETLPLAEASALTLNK